MKKTWLIPAGLVLLGVFFWQSKKEIPRQAMDSLPESPSAPLPQQVPDSPLGSSPIPIASPESSEPSPSSPFLAVAQNEPVSSRAEGIPQIVSCDKKHLMTPASVAHLILEDRDPMRYRFIFESLAETAACQSTVNKNPQSCYALRGLPKNPYGPVDSLCERYFYYSLFVAASLRGDAEAVDY
ncbi:MAG: hypothetical protein HY400_04845, partial [Elusimicrobia bacterium]|nr:hypothetical protein [Elusimicrobiota bacterium]